MSFLSPIPQRRGVHVSNHFGNRFALLERFAPHPSRDAGNTPRDEVVRPAPAVQCACFRGNLRDSGVRPCDGSQDLRSEPRCTDRTRARRGNRQARDVQAQLQPGERVQDRA